MEIIETLVDRAVSDPDFLRRFVADPIRILQDYGIDLSGLPPEDQRALREEGKRSWEGLVEVLEQRISRMGITGSSLGPSGRP